MYKLIIDTREKKVSRHVDEFAGLNVSIGQITTGDYAICRNDVIIAIFERKSLKDYGASIRDGRHANKEKLLALRLKTGCRVFYIIEKRPSHDPTVTYGGLPWSSIRASISHLMIRDGISMIYTDNTLHTAQELRYMMETLQTMKGDDAVFTVGPVLEDTPIVDQRPLLFVRHDRTELCIVRVMWAKFKGITVNTADEYSKKWSLFDAINGIDLNGFKLSNGRKPTKIVLQSLAKIDDKVLTTIFAEIPGISDKTAPAIVKAFRATPITFTDVAALKNLLIPKKLGPKKAENIVKFLSYKSIPLLAPPQEPIKEAEPPQEPIKEAEPPQEPIKEAEPAQEYLSPELCGAIILHLFD